MDADTEDLLRRYRECKALRKAVMATSRGGKHHPARQKAHYVGDEVRYYRRMLMARGIDPQTGESPYKAYDDLQGGE